MFWVYNNYNPFWSRLRPQHYQRHLLSHKDNNSILNNNHNRQKVGVVTSHTNNKWLYSIQVPMVVLAYHTKYNNYWILLKDQRRIVNPLNSIILKTLTQMVCTYSCNLIVRWPRWFCYIITVLLNWQSLIAKCMQL